MIGKLLTQKDLDLGKQLLVLGVEKIDISPQVLTDYIFTIEEWKRRFNVMREIAINKCRLLDDLDKHVSISSTDCIDEEFEERMK